MSPGSGARRLPEALRQFLRFNIVGVLNTTIDVAVFAALTWGGINYPAAQVCSYACGLLNSYVLNRGWTFGHRGPFQLRRALRFLAVNLVSLGVALIALWVFRDLAHTSLAVGKTAATAASVTVNFTGNRIWVWR